MSGKEVAKTTRRRFMEGAAVAGITVAGAPAIIAARGANERIRVGFIGVGNQGSHLIKAFRKCRDAEIAALCDVYKPYLDRDRSAVHPRFLEMLGARVPEMGEAFAGNVETYGDFRDMLEKADIDAVCIATPDHWHALQMIAAVGAGMDVYVEKPLTNRLAEGRAMIDAWKKTDRIVQVGLNRRGATIYRKLAGMVRNGEIGKVSVARAYRISNMYPDGIGRLSPADPPEGLDWDMWLGPREKRPFQYNILPYNFRWWKSFSSQMGNWGVHYMDAIRWLMGEEAPVAVSAHGSHEIVRDDRTIPDTMEVTFEFASGAMARFGIYEAGSGPGVEGGEIELRGTDATLVADTRGYTLTPARPGQFQTWSPKGEAVTYRLEEREDIVYSLVRNFLDCVKTRETPLCDLETGHRSTCFSHLANISLEVGERIEWDAENERITNIPRANDYLSYEYRSPWKL